MARNWQMNEKEDHNPTVQDEGECTRALSRQIMFSEMTTNLFKSYCICPLNQRGLQESRRVRTIASFAALEENDPVGQRRPLEVSVD